MILAGTCPSRLCRSEDGGRTWTELAADIVQACPRIMHTRVTTLAADPAIAEVAQRHGATPSQIALAWLLHHSERVLLIPGTGSIRCTRWPSAR